MVWQHYNPVRLLVGAGVSRQLADFLPLGRILLVTTEGMCRRGTAADLQHLCRGNEWVVRCVSANPELDDLDNLCGDLRQAGCVAIVALGGGSVLDAAKVLSATLCAPGEMHLTHWLRDQSDYRLPKSLPVYCLPTTAGTGAEVTPFATVWDKRSGQKHSLSGESLYPQMAFLDPELTVSLPWQETLFSALDATSHSLETLWNRHATPLSCALATQALKMILAALPTLQKRMGALSLRSKVQEASLLGGLAISQSRTTLAHSISYPLTARYGVPHGLACSFTLAALAEQVQRHQAFPNDVPAELISNVVAMLKELRLSDYLDHYCTGKEVLGCLDEMFTPSRADNFILNANTEIIRDVLTQSCDKQERQ